MVISPKKIADELVKVERECRSCEHILNVVMPLAENQKLVLKALEKALKAEKILMSLVLKFEHIKREIILSKNKDKNIDIFFRKSLKYYGLHETDKKTLAQLFDNGRKHELSGFEFSRKNNVVIMDDDLNTYELKKDDVFRYVQAVRKLLVRFRIKIKQDK